MAVSVPSTTPQAQVDSARRTATFSIRGLALVLSLALVAGAQYAFAERSLWGTGWWLALGAVLVAATWQFRLVLVDWRHPAGREWGLAPQIWRRIIGTLVVLGGVALWADGTQIFYDKWHIGFDRGWLSWAGAAIVVSIGLRILQAPRSEARNRLARWEWVALTAALIVAAFFRLANYDHFPPESGISQIEELQAGQFGDSFLKGDRTRWEFIGQAWLGALSITYLGRSLWSVRVAYSIIAFLKVVPAYFYFRALAGPIGALAGTALLSVCAWDTIVNRIPGQHDQFVVLVCMALLAGPAVRGAWFVYPLFGVLAGYTFYTYVAYRPLVVFVLIGALIASTARRDIGPMWRILRAGGALVIVIGIYVSMFLPLTQRLGAPGQFDNEYMNGWNRAHAIQPYYGPTDTWAAAIQKRWDRIKLAAGLYYTQGDTNPLHNVEGRPLIDVVTGSLLLFGVAYCALMWWRGFYGIALAFFAVTFAGTLVATGNFDVLRCASTVPHVYALVAIGGGALWAAAQRSFGRKGEMAVLALLAGGVLWAGYWNAKLLNDLWSSPVVMRHYRYDLAYLLNWLRQNTPGTQVVGLIPYNAHVVFRDSDGAWLRGPDVKGQTTWDLRSTLVKLAQQKGPSTLVLFSDSNSKLEDVAAFVREAMPGIELQPGPADSSGTVPLAYAFIPDPSELVQAQSWTELLCRGIRARFDVVAADGSVIATFTEMVPYIDRHTFPNAVREFIALHEGRATGIEARWEGDFTVTKPGRYSFFADAYDGIISFTIDDKNYPPQQEHPVPLQPGTHHFIMTGHFQPRTVEPTARLWWREAGSSEDLRALPFYRLSPPDADCLAAMSVLNNPGPPPSGDSPS